MRGLALSIAIIATALGMPVAALGANDRVAEDDGVVSTTSSSYVDLGGPSITVNIGSAGTPVSIWFYAQAMQSPPISSQTSWYEVVDNGALVLQSFWDNSNAGWGTGLWSGPNQPSTGAQNITDFVGTFTPSHGKHTYQVLWRAGAAGNTVSWRYRTLDVRVGNSTAAAPDLTHPATP